MDEHTANYTVLARRFRPQTFAEVVGQEHVGQALRNAIQSDRVAHAYLFTGARGVGKTSMARILAKSLNCPNAVDANPCNECEICQGIAVGHDVDVLEIDGASNRGIDDIRLLRSNVNVKSMRTANKVYIIDEVHMLTKDAFNALLKTLEEPPPNVKFVFCTTEPNKVPDTILSRCQRFDFSTIQTTRIVERLRQISEAEGKNVEPAALEMVARRATGSMRDSQSLLDQVLAFGGDVITADTIHQLLGTASDERLIALGDALINRDRSRVLALFSDALDSGVQLSELTDQLVDYLRDLMVLAAGADQVGLLSVAEEQRQHLAKQAKKWGMQTIVAAMQILAETKNKMQRVTYGRSLAELALIRISLLNDLADLDELIQQLKSGALPATGSRPAPTEKKKSDQTAPALAVTSSSETAAASTMEPGNAERQTAEDRAAASVAESAEEVAADELPRIPFDESSKDRLWRVLIAQMAEQHRRYLHQVNTVAIIGPKRLVLTFPKRYHFNKDYCERPDILGRLEQLARRITGQGVQIQFDLATEDEPEVEESAAARSQPQRIRAEDVTDPFVQQVQSLFNADVIQVRDIANNHSKQE